MQFNTEKLLEIINNPATEYFENADDDEKNDHILIHLENMDFDNFKKLDLLKSDELHKTYQEWATQPRGLYNSTAEYFVIKYLGSEEKYKIKIVLWDDIDHTNIFSSVVNKKEIEGILDFFASEKIKVTDMFHNNIKKGLC